MQLFKLLNRVSFICNTCYLAALLILWLPNPPEGSLVSTVIIMGCLMGLPLNAIVLSWSLTLSLAGKWRSASLPVWLPACNFAIFCLQFISLIQHLK